MSSLTEYRLARTQSASLLSRSSSASRIPLVRSSSVSNLPYIYNRPPYNRASADYYPHRHYRGSKLFDDYTFYEPLYYRSFGPAMIYDAYRSRYQPYYHWTTPSYRHYLWRPRYSAYSSNFIDPYYNWYSRSAYYSSYRPSLFDVVYNGYSSAHLQRIFSWRRSMVWDSVRHLPALLPSL